MSVTVLAPPLPQMMWLPDTVPAAPCILTSPHGVPVLIDAAGNVSVLNGGSSCAQPSGGVSPGGVVTPNALGWLSGSPFSPA